MKAVDLVLWGRLVQAAQGVVAAVHHADVTNHPRPDGILRESHDLREDVVLGLANNTVHRHKVLTNRHHHIGYELVNLLLTHLATLGQQTLQPCFERVDGLARLRGIEPEHTEVNTLGIFLHEGVDGVVGIEHLAWYHMQPPFLYP